MTWSDAARRAAEEARRLHAHPRKQEIRDERPPHAAAMEKLRKAKINHWTNVEENGVHTGPRLLRNPQLVAIRKEEQYMSQWHKAQTPGRGFIRVRYGAMEGDRLVGTIHKNSAGRVEFNENISGAPLGHPSHGWSQHHGS